MRLSGLIVATGLNCWIRRGPLGNLCGYVGVNTSHPAYGYTYWTYNNDGKPVTDKIALRINKIQVHGGLTYSEKEGGLWWFGFDCAHLHDLSPSMEAMRKDMYEGRELPSFCKDEIYRNIEYVTKEVQDLAKQLSKVKS